ncbi:MAG TPA: hypothetical protein VGF23_20575 [Gaiellaceae bacterium]|jgi:hypothetical protein
MSRFGPLAREAVLSATIAASVAAVLAWLGPPGTDLAAHAYQRTLFLQHGFALWNNFWYAGRYSFVTYSVLYYPLAGLLGIRLLAVATVATAALAFAVVIGREWGPTARWSSRSFGVVWAGIVLSAAFPFALGAALGLLALWALQARAHWRFALLAVLTLAASPVAFLLLVVVVGGVALARRSSPRRHLVPAAAVAVAAGAELVLSRAFPDPGRYPFSPAEAAAGLVFCGLGLALTWRVENARVLRSVFLVYTAAFVGVYLVPSGIGENVARLRYAAIPLAVLVLSLRAWRPRLVGLLALGLAVSWNLTPLAASYARSAGDPAASSAYWSGTIRYLHAHLGPAYRVEAVDTADHWPAVYLARARIPLARGWFRQDDFPENQVLYSPLGPRAYLRWLHGLGIRYVVLTGAPPDYSARGEARLLASGRSGLHEVARTGAITIYAVPNPQPIVGAGASVVALTQTRVELALRRPGRFRLAVRWSPYWTPSAGCLTRGRDGMLRLTSGRPGTVRLSFDVDAGRALQTVTGSEPPARCASRARSRAGRTGSSGRRASARAAPA